MVIVPLPISGQLTTQKDNFAGYSIISGMTCNEAVQVTLLEYYNAFRVVTVNYTAYWYSASDKHVCTEDVDEFYDTLGNITDHNARVIAMSAVDKTAFYFSNTKYQNIVARSDGMYRDFGSESVIMFPAGYDFEAQLEYDKFITSTWLAPWLESEIC